MEYLDIVQGFFLALFQYQKPVFNLFLKSVIFEVILFLTCLLLTVVWC